MALCKCGCGGSTKRVYVLGHNSRVVHPMQGRTHSEEARKKISEAHSGKPSWSKGIKKTKEQIYKMAEAMKAKWRDPEFRARVIASRKGKQCGVNHPMYGRKHTEETRRKLSESHMGLPSGAKGHKHSEESRKKMSKSHRGVPLSAKHCASIGEKSKQVWASKSKEEREQWAKNISEGEKGKFVSEETNRKNSEAKKKAWQDPAYARKCLVFNVPNKAEIKLLGILDEMYPGEWKFVGDGQLLIAGKCPDFVNVNGKKKIIELYGQRWHANHDPQDRINIFKPFGYDTLVVWDKELDGTKKLKRRIESFCGGM